ncbi:hypothetical protein [Andreprevotia lacus]|uniref:hypothetical protein n=1 Tax=Andreprevotia lacus TaxID=1121000 RepID=UPI000A002551|nr:hypothetical protein [Andreprevotia lacus]
MSTWEAALLVAQANDNAYRKNARMALAQARRERLAAQQSGDEATEAKALLDEARSHWEINQFEQSLRRSRSALRLLATRPDPAQTARAWQQIATALLAQGKLTRALQSWLSGLAIASEHHIFPAICESYLGIGNLFLIEDAANRAELAFRYAYDLSEETGDDGYICKTGLYLLSALTQLGWIDQARRILKRLWPLIAAHPNWSPSSRSDYYLYLAACQIADKQHALADDSLAQAADICRQGGLLWGHARVGELTARLQLARGQAQSAITPLNEAIGLAAHFDNGYLLQRLYLVLCEAHEALGDAPAALAAHELYHTARMRLLRDSNERMRILDANLARRVDMELRLHKLQHERARAPTRPGKDACTGFDWLDIDLPAALPQTAKHAAVLAVVVDNLREISLRRSVQAGNQLLAVLADTLRTACPQAHGLRIGGSVLVLLADAATTTLWPKVRLRLEQAARRWSDEDITVRLIMADSLQLDGETATQQLRRTLLATLEAA